MTSIRLTTDTEWLRPELNEVIRLFMGDVPISDSEGEAHIIHTSTEENGLRTDSARFEGGDVSYSTAKAVHGGLEEKRVIKRCAKTALFLLLSKTFNRIPPWGSLTGIRPTRLVYEGLENGLTLKQALDRIKTEFFVSDEKVSLLKETVEMQRGFIYPPENTFDLYIGIPFCVTRCSYCSFSSGEIGDGRLTEPYVEALKTEIRLTKHLIDEAGLKLRAGYVGGGTPTALSCGQLARVLDAAMEAFPDACEWTVEAGRPDTIDREKLKMLKAHGVGRISVNPQTFSDETLKIIGRAHTAKQTVDAYLLAREEGFDHINMDIIAALPGEDIAVFENTLNRVTDLRPESVTVHSLAIKRSSRLHEALTLAGDAHSGVEAAEYAGQMISLARKRLEEGGWRPYYLYRQKYMAGNLENVGYALPGNVCLYNIGNMEETARVLALGAGAISKWVYNKERRIERAPNLKNIEEYIARTEEMVQRKRALIFEDGKTENK